MVAAVVFRSCIICGNAGRYMSMAKGPRALSNANMVIRDADAFDEWVMGWIGSLSFDGFIMLTYVYAHNKIVEWKKCMKQRRRCWTLPGGSNAKARCVPA